MSRRLISLFLLLTASACAQDPDRPLHAVGRFSNMRYTEEHAYGYSVDLWRDGDSLIGLFYASRGLQGDTPRGLLERVKFNSHTGALSFTARLSIGVKLLPGGGQEPSRDLFEFSGTLKSTLLSGILRESDLTQPTRPVSPQRVQLRLQPQAAIFPADTWAAWKRQVDSGLKNLGPKW